MSRDKILKEGTVRYRQYSIGLQKWRQRHLVFKVTHAGRLQLIVYKESPPTAANEIKQISIDEFGGLEHGLRIDSEKYVFAIITTNMTECFSTETPQDLSNWKVLLQEYLGKELLININIPQKQALLRTGRGVLRIRNTGFTITTNENPPRCQGTWQIIHIRKYGGTELFRFQTGSKCPTGEHLYSIETKDNSGLKKLFNDLSNHKPIFADDRLGRRMTLEKSLNQTAPRKGLTPQRTNKNRLSLQATGKSVDKHLYENREQIQAAQGHFSTSELTVPLNSTRRASFDDGIFSPPADIPGHGMSSRKSLTGEEQSRLYQNVSRPGRSSNQEGSPIKKSHFSTINVPVPDGYYNVTPPPLVKRGSIGNGSPSSSPEDKVSYHELRSSVKSPVMDLGPQHSASYERYSPEVTMDVVGDNLVVNKSSQRGKAFSPTFDIQGDGTYQNVEFMRGSNGDGPAKRYVSESLMLIDDVGSSVPATIAEEPWSPHNYTNVQLAQANMLGHNGRTTKTSASRRLKMSETAGLSLDGKPTSSPKTVKHSLITPLHSLPISSSSDNLLDTPPAKSYKSELRSSLSDFEIASSARKEGGRPLDYYNFCAPNLPAHSNNRSGALGLRNKFTLSTVQSPHFSRTPSDHDSTELLSPESGAVEYSKMVPLIAKHSGHDSHEAFRTEISSVGHFKSSNGTTIGRSSSCDCLDSQCLTENTVLILDDRPDSQNTLYDKLAPQNSSGHDAKNCMYDSLEPYQDGLKSGSSSPEISSNLPLDIVNKHFQYDRKVGYLQHGHRYDYIGIELEERQTSKSGSNSPDSMELPSNWTASLPLGIGHQKTMKMLDQPHRRYSNKVTNTQSRRKHLPLQDSGKQISTDSECSRLDSDSRKPRPPRLSRGDDAEGYGVVAYKTRPLFVKQSQPGTSIDSLEFGSSIDSLSRDRLLSSGSHSSGELSMNSHHHEKQDSVSSPVNTYEEVLFSKTDEELSRTALSVSGQMSSEPPEIPMKSPIKSASMARNTPEPVNEPPPLPKRSNSDSTSSKINNTSSPLLPPRPQDPKFTVPLPQAQINFIRPPPPPRPRLLFSSGPDQFYTAVSFSDGTESSAPQRETSVKSPRPSIKLHQAYDSTYASIDFQMTDGLQKTSEQVAREYSESIQQAD